MSISNTRTTHTFFQHLVIAHAAVHSGMIANFGRHLAKLLIEEEAELHIFASRETIYGQSPSGYDLEALGSRFHSLPLPAHFAPLNLVISILLMSISLRRHHVKILHTRSSLMGVVGRVAGKLAGVPVIIHTQDDLYFRDDKLSQNQKRLISSIERLLSTLADRSLFVSEAVFQDALSIGFSKEKCLLVGHDLNEVFQQAATKSDDSKEPVLSLLQQLGVPKDSKIIGCVGRFVQLKGIDIFLEAAKKLANDFPDWSFVIKGDGPLRNSFASFIAQNGLTDRVFLFTEELSLKDLPSLYRCFDIFTLPTRREGFGMVFAEALVMGVPVIGPRLPPITEVVPQECGVLVAAEDIDALVQALKDLMIDDELRKQLAINGKAYALKRWSGRAAAERIAQIYQDILAEKFVAK